MKPTRNSIRPAHLPNLALGALFCLGVFCPTPGHAQTADDYIAQGRSSLAAHNLTNANTQFAAALALAPNSTTGSVFYAATRLLILADKPAGKALLDRLGFAQTNRSVYGWTADMARDTNGVLLLLANMSASEISAFMRTNVLPEVMGAAANLAKVTNTNFTLLLSSNETTTVDVTMDYGDVQLLRAVLEFAQYLGYTVYSWNADVQLSATRSLLTHAGTAQSFLAEYPSLLTFATTNDLADARQAFSDAVGFYLSASDFIRNRPTNVTRLFNYDPSMSTEENNFRTTLTQLRQSLDEPTVLSINTNLTVDLAQHFNGAHDVRSFLPEFAGDSIVAGSLPDPSFGGILEGFPGHEIEYFLGRDKQVGGYSHGIPVRALPFVSRFSSVTPVPEGLAFTLDALDQSIVLIEASTDLRTWTPAVSGVVQNGVLTFMEPPGAGASQQFYRAVDASKVFVLSGRVLEVPSGSPLPGAQVTVSFPYGPGTNSLVGYADAAGNFFVVDWLPPASRWYQIDVSLPG